MGCDTGGEGGSAAAKSPKTGGSSKIGGFKDIKGGKTGVFGDLTGGTSSTGISGLTAAKTLATWRMWGWARRLECPPDQERLVTLSWKFWSSAMCLYQESAFVWNLSWTVHSAHATAANGR